MRVSLLGNEIAEFSSRLISTEITVGAVAENRSAVIGREGWCFIYEGSNNYRAGYLEADAEGKGLQWASLVEQRRRESMRLGAKFLQVIVPNKLSVLSECFPEKLDTNVTFILQNFLSSPVREEVLVPLEIFRKESIRECVFRRNDSHLTVGGNALLTELILEKLGITGYVSELVVTKRSQHKGDLGGKYSPAVEEDLATPAFDRGFLDQRRVEKVREIISPSFNGTHQVFKNENAPIKEKIVVFGNSFFERVPSWGLSPFFAALFSEFHFFWTPNVDFEYVAQERPAYVIAQTCERFMSKLPVDQYAQGA